MNLPIQITGVDIRQNVSGLYCLNDLHQASGGEERHRPGNWLRNEQTVELIEEIKQRSDLIIGTEKSVEEEEIHFSDLRSESVVPVEVIKGGPSRGTYVSELLVYNYAAWISPRFNLLVFETFKRAVHGEQVSNRRPTSELKQALAELEMICDSA